MKIIQLSDQSVRQIIDALLDPCRKPVNEIYHLAADIRHQLDAQAQSKAMTADEIFQAITDEEFTSQLTDFQFQEFVIAQLNMWRDEAVANALKAQSK